MTIFRKIENLIDDDIVKPVENAASFVWNSAPAKYVEKGVKNAVSIPYNIIEMEANGTEALANNISNFVNKTSSNIIQTEHNIADTFKYLPYVAAGIAVYLILKK